MERSASQKSASAAASSTTRNGGAMSTRPVPAQSSSRPAAGSRTASPVPLPSVGTVVAVTKGAAAAEHDQHLHREQREAVEQLQATASTLTRFHESLTSQQEQLTASLAGFVAQLAKAAEDRVTSVEHERDALAQQVAEQQAALEEAHAQIAASNEERQQMLSVAEHASATIRQLQLDNARLQEEFNLAVMAKDTELETLREAASQRDELVVALKSHVEALSNQLLENEEARTVLSQGRDKASMERARRSAQLHEARTEAEVAVAELTRRLQDTEDDVVNLADALQSRAGRYSGRVAGELSPSARPGSRIRAVSDAIFQKLDALRAERDEYRSQLETARAQWAVERAQLLASKADVMHALAGQEKELGVLRQATANVPATRPAKPIVSLREARAQHKMSTTAAVSQFADPNQMQGAGDLMTPSVLHELEDLSSSLRQRPVGA